MSSVLYIYHISKLLERCFCHLWKNPLFDICCFCFLLKIRRMVAWPPGVTCYSPRTSMPNCLLQTVRRKQRPPRQRPLPRPQPHCCLRRGLQGAAAEDLGSSPVVVAAIFTRDHIASTAIYASNAASSPNSNVRFAIRNPNINTI